MSEPRLDYLVEMGGLSEAFGGDCWEEWFFNMLDASYQLIDDWNITSPPEYVKILIKREEDDRAEYPWILLGMPSPSNGIPFFNQEEVEQAAREIFDEAQVLRKAYLDMSKKPPEINPDAY